MRRHLIIRALHRDKSFLSGGVDRLQQILLEEGNQVVVRDLYEMNFNPILTTSDFEAMQAGNLPDDIAEEQEYIKSADYIWFVFPIWWSSMPAILKGYIDRIFLSGFAYRMEGDTPKGLLSNKEIILLNSMGMSEHEYKESGMFKALELTIDKGVFDFTGMKVIAHKYFTSIISADKELREDYYGELEDLAKRVGSQNYQQKPDKKRLIA